jgi:uncharacterized NAD(P)/FAD-binding protein YdhS
MPSIPPDAMPPGLDASSLTVARVVRAVRAHADARGGDWREVVGALRPVTPALWSRFGPEERSRFLRHVRPWWDVHRHRAAPRTADAVEALIAAGDLSVRAARILGYRPVAKEVEVTIRPRGSSTAGRVHVDRVVNCTGPSTDVRRVGDPLLDTLLARRLIRPDPLGLGLETSDDGALLDAAGTPSGILHLVGPLLKARFWEATAVPELREHAARLAARLLP